MARGINDPKIEPLAQELLPILKRQGIGVGVAFGALENAYLEIFVQGVFGAHHFDLQTRQGIAAMGADVAENLATMIRATQADLAARGQDSIDEYQRILNNTKES